MLFLLFINFPFCLEKLSSTNMCVRVPLTNIGTFSSNMDYLSDRIGNWFFNFIQSSLHMQKMMLGNLFSQCSDTRRESSSFTVIIIFLFIFFDQSLTLFLHYKVFLHTSLIDDPYQRNMMQFLIIFIEHMTILRYFSTWLFFHHFMVINCAGEEVSAQFQFRKMKKTFDFLVILCAKFADLWDSLFLVCIW